MGSGLIYSSHKLFLKSQSSWMVKTDVQMSLFMPLTVDFGQWLICNWLLFNILCPAAEQYVFLDRHADICACNGSHKKIFRFVTMFLKRVEGLACTLSTRLIETTDVSDRTVAAYLYIQHCPKNVPLWQRYEFDSWRFL